LTFFIFENTADLIRSLAVNRHLENAPHDTRRVTVHKPLVFVVRRLVVTVRAVTRSVLSRYSPRLKRRLYFLAILAEIELVYDFAEGREVVAVAVVVVSNAFRVSAGERTRQFGILKSVGATKKQIAQTIIHEGVFLSVIAIPIGLILGLLIEFVGTFVVGNF
jgi:putative ABC transport system permease protein